jgi:hypothetical protein
MASVSLLASRGNEIGGLERSDLNGSAYVGTPNGIPTSDGPAPTEGVWGDGEGNHRTTG